MESQLKHSYGLDRLKLLNELARQYQTQESRKALRYAKQAVNLSENIFSAFHTPSKDRIHQLQAYFQLGELQYISENYFESRENLQSSRSIALLLNETGNLEKINIYLTDIQTLIDTGKIKEGILSRTIGDLKVGEAISSTSRDISIKSEITIARLNEKKRNFLVAIEHYEKAINLLRNAGDTQSIYEIQLKVAVLLDSLGKYHTAQKYLSEAITDMESGMDTTPEMSINVKEQALISSEEDFPIASNESAVSDQIIEHDSFKFEKQYLKELADSFALEQNHKKSLGYYELYQSLSQKIATDSLALAEKMKQRQDEMLLLKQQKQIADLNVEAIEREAEKQVRLRNTSIAIALLIIACAVFILEMYLTKRKEHKKLVVAYHDLNHTKGKLEDAEKRIVRLLQQQVSGDIAQELLMNSSDKPGEKRFVCIMFLDIRDFTPMAEKLTPEELIEYQNKVFGFMIDIVQKYNGNINQLLGDGFMATFGAPVSHGNDCENAFMAANEILEQVRVRSQAGTIRNTRIGIGLHAGFVVTGNVGNEARKQYSVTGNPVIIAARVEQLNKTYKTQLIITEEVYEKLETPLKSEHSFLEVSVKGRTNPIRILKIA
ncbi:MAG: adenylate/guanylate cyclase domain-containing protein [Bacteroidota bacterium]